AEFLEVRGRDNKGSDISQVPITAAMLTKQKDGWMRVTVPGTVLNPHGMPMEQLVLRAHKPVPNKFSELQRIVIVQFPKGKDGKSALQANLPNLDDMPGSDISMQIQCDQAGHAISPEIYGIAYN